MPTFMFNKLIRDKLEQEYIRLDHRAKYVKLSDAELIEALKRKIVEEAEEIPADGLKEDVASELADVMQVVEDIAAKLGVSSQDILEAKDRKFAKKGGFSKGLFVERVTLNDDDEWNEYYRKSPEKYKEL